ncbi:MAG: hypothetical protein J0H17_09370 [Rhizobiales bacterium]|nr:hypothetical protein [Hyphomicrobiales bacterium]
MPQVRVTKNVSVKVSDVAIVRYRAGWEGLAPEDHVDRILKAGAGERLSYRRGAEPDPVDLVQEMPRDA